MVEQKLTNAFIEFFENMKTEIPKGDTFEFNFSITLGKSTTKNVDVNIKKTENTEEIDYTVMNLAQLKASCKSRGLKVSGTKPQLIQRLLGKEDNTKKTKKAKKSKSPSVKIQKEIPVIQAKRNEGGHYIHYDNEGVSTGLVFDKESKIIIGVYDTETKTVKPLSVENIETCKQYKLDYEIPDTFLDDSMNTYKEVGENPDMEDINVEEEEVVVEYYSEDEGETDNN